MYILYLVYPHPGCTFELLHLLAIANNIGMNMSVEITLRDPAFNSIWYILFGIYPEVKYLCSVVFLFFKLF